MKVGIAISTRNRPKSFAKCLDMWYMMLPMNTPIVIVDDDSDDDYAITHKYDYDQRIFVYKFSGKNVGIPAVKNKGIELLYEAGCTDIFLSDDDIWPTSPDSLLPYLNSGINHLSYTFTRFSNGSINGNRTFQMQETKRENGISWYNMANGCLLYYKRICFDTVGGMDPAYGLGMFEHIDLSHRIYNAGLVPHPYMDISDSHKYFHSLDQHLEAGRTMDWNTRVAQCERNRPIFEALGDKATFVSIV